MPATSPKDTLPPLDDLHHFVAQMLRVLLAVAATNPTAVDSVAKAQAVLRDEAQDFNVGGWCNWGEIRTDPHPVAPWDQVLQLGLRAEPLAVSLFFETYWALDHCGCLECCGPPPLHSQRPASA